MGQTLSCGLLAIGMLAGCERAQRQAEATSTTRQPPPCNIYTAEPVCRVGCDADGPPKKVFDVVPDLSGLDLGGVRGVEIAEILIDDRGAVTDACLRRGVRDDVDLRAVAAIRQWRYEPARLRHSTPPGALTSQIITVALPVGQR
jgi:hypothetical protein